MIKSMTGYGKGEASSVAGKFSVEMRSVNHRYGEVTVKLPRQILALEVDLRRRVSDRFKRGKIDLFIQFEPAAGSNTLPNANIPLAMAYHEAFSQVSKALGGGDVPIGMILSQKDVISFAEASADPDSFSGILDEAFNTAMDSLEKMRIREGELLTGEIGGRVADVRNLVDSVAKRAPVAVTANTERLRERIARLLGDTSIDEMRLVQEIAVLSDKMDITEELVRLRSHFSQFDTILLLDEPVGRKLDFLIQEMNREVNTIGSKANDSEIAAIVVELKSELEKVREQVQNIE